MKHINVLATALGLGALWLLPACSGETEAGGAPEAPETPAATETTTQTTVHYTCAHSCGGEADAALSEGIPQHCGAPMVAKP
jgi:hypothetical protein